MLLTLNSGNNMEDVSSRWKSVYLTGAVSALLAIILIVADMIIGSLTGSTVSAAHQGAKTLLLMLDNNPLLALYQLDVLNLIIQVLMLPAMLAVYGALRRVNKAPATLAMMVFTIGSLIFIINNAAPAMYDLGIKYSLATTDSQLAMYEAAGEAVMAKGIHGSVGAFPGFLLSTLGMLLFSVAMIHGKVFSKSVAWTGIAGNIVMLGYVVVITLFPWSGEYALFIAMPGGILVLLWTVFYMIRLFKFSLSGPSH